MNHLLPDPMSPYLFFTVAEWATLRADTPMTLTADEIDRLRSLNDPISIAEVEEVYLPISRLLSYHVEASIRLFGDRRKFLGVANRKKTPFIIGIGGSVAVGKSTTARLLKELLARWPGSPHVELVTTDGFLLPNRELEARGLMERKGFPESYDMDRLLAFLADIKAGKGPVSAPVYSHLAYDVVAGAETVIDRPDILILEGLNVLQTGPLPADGMAIPFVSDFFDFSLYIDAEESAIRQWYIDRFMRLRETRFRDPKSYFHKYSKLNDVEALAMAQGLWDRINLVNLLENILPTRLRADLILSKGGNHAIANVALRKL